MTAVVTVLLVGLLAAVVGSAITGRRYGAQIDAVRAALLEMTTQRDYWRVRAEKLVDAALARAGAIHQPTMEPAPPRDRVSGAAAMVTAAMAITEIDSKRKVS